MKKEAFAALFFLFLILIAGLAYPQTSRLTVALSDLCVAMNELLPTVAMLLVLVGSVVYASGQIMGAETRARANVWATACITGALMGMLITTVAPSILGAVYGNEVSCTASGGSTGPTMSSCASCTYDESVDDCCGSGSGRYLCAHVLSGPACVPANYPYCYTGGGGTAVSSRTCPP